MFILETVVPFRGKLRRKQDKLNVWLPWGGQIRTIYLGFIFTYKNKRRLNVFYFLKNQNTAFINSDQSQQPNSDWPMPVRRKSLNATNAFFTERRKLQKNNGQNSACFIFRYYFLKHFKLTVAVFLCLFSSYCTCCTAHLANQQHPRLQMKQVCVPRFHVLIVKVTSESCDTPRTDRAGDKQLMRSNYVFKSSFWIWIF